MARINVERGVERLAEQAEKLSASVEKLVAAARRGEHQALAERLERLRLDLQQHLEGLHEHRAEHLEQAQAEPAGVAGSAPPPTAGGELPAFHMEAWGKQQGDDEVDEAVKESFPASDPSASY
ncbi:MAG: hypothetical protein IRZ16_23125 [Myxococcaceae bacterium]|nr:hypothetical protein [Myxococcaceae bacterium]